MTLTQFVVSPAVLGGLAGLVPGDKSPLSPLHIPNPPALTPEQHEALFEAGMLDQNGLVESARLMLAALSEAPSFARVRLNAPAGYLDEAIHFTGEGTYSVGISNTPDGLVLSAPGDAGSIFSQIQEYTGSSSHEIPVWSVELLPLEMLCLAALMDLRRKAVLHAIVDQQPVVPLPCDAPAITNAIQSMWGNPQWLTNAIQNATAIRTPPAVALVQTALSALVEKNQAWHQSGNYYPIPEAIQTADRFLLVGTVIHLDCGSANMQNRYTLLRQTWLQAGITEMLNISQVKDNLRLQLVTPAAALDRIQFFLTNFDAVPAPPLEVVELSLAIQAGIGAGKTYPIGEETVIGRSEQAAVHILDVRASRRHAVIRKLTQGYQLTDAGSTNGTFLNGDQMTGPSWLHAGDIIAIGETQIKVIRSGDQLAAVASDRTVFAGGSAQSPTPSQPNPTKSQPEAAEAAEQAQPAQAVEIPAAPQPDVPVSAEPEPPLPAAEEPAPLQESSPDTMEDLSQPAEQVSEPVEAPVQPVDSQLKSAADFSETQPPTPAAITGSEEPSEPATLPQTDALPAIPEDTPQELVCPQCGSEINPGARFCGTCGKRLDE